MAGRVEAGGTVATAGDLRSRLVATTFGAPVSLWALRPATHFDAKEYYLPTWEELEKLCEQRSCSDLARHPEAMDGGTFAYSFKADAARNRLKKAESAGGALPLAIGILWGGMGGENSHVANVAITADTGILLVEVTPQNWRISTPGQWSRPVDYILI